MTFILKSSYFNRHQHLSYYYDFIYKENINLFCSQCFGFLSV